MTIGPRATLQFFTKRRNFRGSGAFLGGFLLVLIGWAVTGMAAQSYGFLLLFAGASARLLRRSVRLTRTDKLCASADFLPTALPFARRVPVVGYLLSLPPVRAVRGAVDVLRCGGALTHPPGHEQARQLGQGQRPPARVKYAEHEAIGEKKVVRPTVQHSNSPTLRSQPPDFRPRTVARRHAMLARSAAMVLRRARPTALRVRRH